MILFQTNKQISSPLCRSSEKSLEKEKLYVTSLQRFLNLVEGFSEIHRELISLQKKVTERFSFQEINGIVIVPRVSRLKRKGNLECLFVLA